jgi:hypothetical protein
MPKKDVVTAEEEPKRIGQEYTRWIIKVNGYVRGTVERFNPAPGEEHPYKAFHRSRMLGVFYVSEHGRHAKQKAIDAVIGAA